MLLAATLICSVIGITDGDTLTARCEMSAGLENVKIRLAEIDAPEKVQAYGARSKQNLAELCFKKAAIVKPQKADRYGRTIARVECDGSDASVEQVRTGMAWVFDRYATDLSLYPLQEAARNEHRGLWADLKPMAPWDWRQAQRAHSTFCSSCRAANFGRTRPAASENINQTQ